MNLGLSLRRLLRATRGPTEDTSEAPSAPASGTSAFDEGSLHYYVRLVSDYAHGVQLAHHDLRASFGAPREEQVGRVFAAAHGMLSAAAMISKLLWPDVGDDRLSEEQRAWGKERGRQLRNALGVKSIPLLEKRRVRNSLEHFDERVDRFFLDGTATGIYDRNIGGSNFFGGATPRHLRFLNTDTWTLIVLDDDVSLTDLASTAAGIYASAQTWLAAYDRRHFSF